MAIIYNRGIDFSVKNNYNSETRGRSTGGTSRALKTCGWPFSSTLSYSTTGSGSTVRWGTWLRLY